MQPTKQSPVSAYTVSHDIGVASIVLGAGDTEPIAQAIELLRINRMHDKAPVDQGVDNWSVRNFDANGDGAYRPGYREQPVA
jgi:hypothetical protein